MSTATHHGTGRRQLVFEGPFGIAPIRFGNRPKVDPASPHLAAPLYGDGTGAQGYRLSRNQPATRPTTLPRWTLGASAAVIWRAINLRAETASRGP